VPSLDPEQLQTFQDWIQRQFPNGLSCPLCKQNEWETGEVIAGFYIDSTGQMHDQGPTTPMVQVRCTTCRNILLFEALPMGLIRNGS
jgi:hypothetical protein